MDGVGRKEQMLSKVMVFDARVFGGKWCFMRTSGEAPEPRSAHCMCSDNQDTIFLVGGKHENGLAGGMFCLNVRSRRWSRFHLTDPISERALGLYGQSMCYYENSLILFGGCNDIQYSSESFLFDFKTLRWTLLETWGEKPSARYKHEAFIPKEFDPNSLFVIGGGDHLPKGTYLDVYCLELCSLKWEKMHCNGYAPIGRVAFSSCYDSLQNLYFIFGGFDSQNERLNDLYCLELPSMSWKPILVKDSPSKRAFHSMCFFNNSIFVFGGSDGDKRVCDDWKLNFRRQIPTLVSLAAQKLKEVKDIRIICPKPRASVSSGTKLSPKKWTGSKQT